MIFTSKYISLAVPTSGVVKKGFFAEGEAVQKKLCAVDHIPLMPGEGALFLPNLSPPMHRLEFPPSLPGMAHGATIHASHHCSTGNCKMSRRAAAWATSASGSLRPGGSQTGNLMKPLRKVNYAQKTSNVPGRTCHHERS